VTWKKTYQFSVFTTMIFNPPSSPQTPMQERIYDKIYDNATAGGTVKSKCFFEYRLKQRIILSQTLPFQAIPLQSLPL
jgi:hypothetical protein